MRAILQCLFVAMALATAWAARGQLGHEHGATWAGAVGVMALIFISGNKDWKKRWPAIATIGAIGWGAGGMISYGIVVGYSYAPDYGNALYGIMMLGVIGGLYGFMGGGLTGLALSDDEKKKIDWASLITQMVAGAWIFWGILIHQLGWFMTPPRSELWAACFGACVALGWYMYRNQFGNAWTVACWSALGAGFGFAFGNTLQRIGLASGIHFNWWNVMEYSIGFFGGLAMAYAIFIKSNWTSARTPDKWGNVIGIAFLAVFIPLANIIEGVKVSKLVRTANNVGVLLAEEFASQWLVYTWILFLIAVPIAAYLFWTNYKKEVLGISFFYYLILYVVLSNIITGVWYQWKFNTQHLYWVNVFLLALMAVKIKTLPAIRPPFKSHYGKILILAIIILMALVGALILAKVDPGHHNLRFGVKE